MLLFFLQITHYDLYMHIHTFPLDVYIVGNDGNQEF
jgi:hypothetical protein